MKKIKIITHSGSFHIDDIFAVTVLVLLLDKKREDYEVIRTRDPEIIKTGDFVVDVGGVYNPDKNLFDHHQEDGAGKRENGIPYSSFGLVWKKFGGSVCTEENVAEIIDKKIAVYIDAEDNGVNLYEVESGINVYTFPKAIKIFRPMFEEERTMDEGFFEALGFVKRILEREILKAEKFIKTKSIIEDVYNNTQDKRLIVLDKYIPAVLLLEKYPEPLFIVAPGVNNDEWIVKAITKGENTFSARKAFPKQWAGKIDSELVELSGVSDAKFCHHSGEYIAKAGSKEGAVALAKLALEN